MISDYTDKVMDKEYDMFMSLMHVCVSKHLFDEHFTVLWANNYYYELIGYTKEEYETLYHNHVDEYYKNDPESLNQMREIIVGAFNRGEIGYEFECIMHTKSGKNTWIKVTGRFTNETVDGIPVIYVIYTDISNLKELQLQLEERTEKLHSALIMAEEANRAKSDFLSRMSHDIRTPMNAIVGMTDIAMAHLDNPDKTMDCLKKIGISSQHLLGLINDVLDMSKIESGKMTLNNDAMWLPEVLESIVAIIQPNLKTKNQEFSVRLLNMKHEHFSCDALRLRQIFINILSNASKFTPEGGKITLEAEERPSALPGTAELLFTFSDTGIGIKPEFLEHLFDAFTREQDSRVDKTEGSGLGMAITKKLVTLMEGTIEVHSEVGKGSTFAVMLPLRIEQEAAPEEPLPRLNIMVVDDDEISCEYTVQMLSEMGLCSEWCSDSVAAVEHIVKAHEDGRDFDAIILDWRMPDQDGVETARLIRSRLQKEIPILIISAYDWTDIKDDIKAAGVNGMLTKPVFPSALRRGLQRYVLGKENFQDNSSYAKNFDFSGRTFLLVEDNSLNREIAVEILTDSGAAVEYAVNGKEGLEKFMASPEDYYDMILMDVQMPVMNGYEAAMQIRALPRRDALTVPIIAMTADAFTEDIKAAKNAGMNGHVAKPLNIAVMKREINRYLKTDKK